MARARALTRKRPFTLGYPRFRNLRNYETNATCAVKITHHFANKMLDRGDRGLITFTSSSAAFLPNPLASIYASTKAFLTSFGASIGAELRPLGIDVVVVHPSPIASRFLENAQGFSAALASGKVAVPPSVIADALFRAAGRFVIYDQVGRRRPVPGKHWRARADAIGALAATLCLGVGAGPGDRCDEAGHPEAAGLQLCLGSHVLADRHLGRLPQV